MFSLEFVKKKTRCDSFFVRNENNENKNCKMNPYCIEYDHFSNWIVTLQETSRDTWQAVSRGVG